MVASSTAAAAGYAFFRDSGGRIARDDLNDLLASGGFAPVSTRMIAHYRSLFEAGSSDYVSINEFDLRRRDSHRAVQTIYISATLGYDLRSLASSLAERGFKVLTAGDVIGEESVNDALRNQISRSDACVALVGSESFDSVLFELGLAYGLGKPIVLAVERHVSDVLSDLQWLPRVVLDSGRQAPLLEAIERMRERPTMRRPPTRRRNTIRGDIARFRELADKATPREFEGVVAELIGEHGAEVYGRSPEDGGFDFAVWASRLEPIVPNPLLVEVKLRLSANYTEAVRRVTGYLDQSGGAGIALLVYRDGPPSQQFGPTYPVLPIRFDELLDELHSQPFSEVVRKRRNLAVHSLAT
jgi:hypothetical protein